MTRSKELEEVIKDYKGCSVQSLYAEFGAEITARIIHVFGGDFLYIPHASTILRDHISKCVIEEYQAGAGYRDIAKNHDISTRTVRRIIDREKLRLSSAKYLCQKREDKH
ncbi:MAG: helix-turn-helix domain-containing protein [Oscillospiraceae bacterium]|nr:helix-turn-helix domain-containing protein [Oscillospiraceae bacterium]